MRGRVLLLLISLMVAAAAVARADRQEAVPLRTPLSLFPTELEGWSGKPLPALDEQVLAILGVDDYLTRAYYRADGAALGLYIGYWQSQRQGDTIHSPQNCLPGAGWAPVSREIIQVADPRSQGDRTLPLNRYVIQKGLDRQLVLYWYQSHGRVVASEYWGKVFLVADAVRLNRTDGALVRVVAPILGDSGDALARAENAALSFSLSLLRKLDGYLPI